MSWKNFVGQMWVAGPGEPETPVDPDWGVGGGHPSHPIAGVGGYPSHPIAGGGGGRPSHPIALPPLPGVWPEPGKPSLPIYIPPETPGVPSHPIFIGETPEHPIQLPPNTIWPPMPPDIGGGSDKIAIFVWIPGVGARWFIYTPAVNPPVPTPKK